MSEPLTDPALGGNLDTAPVGENGAEETTEVVEGSGLTPEGFIPKDRFDGLMSSFNKAQAEAKAKAEEVSALEARIAQYEAQLTKPQEEPVVTDNADITALTQAVSQLAELVTGQVEKGNQSDIESVWNDFPEAVEFKDLFVADSADALRPLLEDFTGRLKKVTGDSAPAGEVTEAAEVTPTEPLGGGGVTAPSIDPTAGDDLAKAVAARDVDAALAALRKKTYGEEDGLVLTPTS